MSKAGQLSDESSTPAIVAMLGRVMAQNPDKISAWMTDLAELPENDKVAIYRAIWLSRTDAGNAYLKRQGLTKYVEKPATDILKMEIESPSIISMIWGCFLATGDEAAVRRIVSAFNYSKYQGALEKYRNSKRAEEDSRDACYEAVFQGRVCRWAACANNIPAFGKFATRCCKARTSTRRSENIWPSFSTRASRTTTRPPMRRRTNRSQRRPMKRG